MIKHELKAEHLFSMHAILHTPAEIIGPVPDGIRVTFYISGGTVDGPALKGRVKPVGADYFTVRPDGMGVLDVRATIETDDNALIYVSYSGLGDLGPDGYAKFLAGELPAELALRTTPRLQSAHPAYQRFHRLLCVGIGSADLQSSTVTYDVYAIS
jgi:hypothetical protein